MDETNDQEMPADDEATEERAEAAPEPERCKRGGGRFIGGLLSGAVIGGALALLLAPLRGEERVRREMMESGTWEGREEEGRLPAKEAVERVQAIAAVVTSRIVAAWAAVRERLHEAVEEG